MKRESIPDIGIIIITALLIVIGINAIYNAAAFYRGDEYNQLLVYFNRYLIFLGVGIVAGIVAYYIDLDFLERIAPIFLIISAIFLILVLIPSVGTKVNGARRWIRFFSFNFQPSEFAKLSLVLYLASICHRKGGHIANFTFGYLPPMLTAILFACLISVEPDLGTALLFLGVTFLVFAFTGAPTKYLILTLVFMLPFIVLIISKNTHMWYRLVAWLKPWETKATKGFQLVQSLRSFMLGGFTGSSFESLSQSRVSLPAASTDFILAVIAQKSGFFGASSIVLLFLGFLIRGIKIIEKTTEPFRQYLSFAIVSLICLQAFINICVVVGLMPTTGIPLPFISYGRNSLVIMLFMTGLLLNISKQRFE